jgi:hypothetical protein
MCLLWSTNWDFISQKTVFFIVTAVITCLYTFPSCECAVITLNCWHLWSQFWHPCQDKQEFTVSSYRNRRYRHALSFVLGWSRCCCTGNKQPYDVFIASDLASNFSAILHPVSHVPLMLQQQRTLPFSACVPVGLKPKGTSQWLPVPLLPNLAAAPSASPPEPRSGSQCLSSRTSQRLRVPLLPNLAAAPSASLPERPEFVSRLGDSLTRVKMVYGGLWAWCMEGSVLWNLTPWIAAKMGRRFGSTSFRSQRIAWSVYL